MATLACTAVGAKSAQGGVIAEAVTRASATGVLCFSFDIRPFVTIGSDNSNIVWLSETSAKVSEQGSANVGVQFRVDSKVLARANPVVEIGDYTLGEWCHVDITLNTETDRFDICVSGPGVDRTMVAQDLALEENLEQVNYIMIYDDSPSPNDLGVDNFRLKEGECDNCPSFIAPTNRLTWIVERFYR